MQKDEQLLWVELNKVAYVYHYDYWRRFISAQSLLGRKKSRKISPKIDDISFVNKTKKYALNCIKPKY